MNKNNNAGFTIVELLIVIVVIGVLASVIVVAYSGMTQRARDASRKSDLANLAKALKLYQTTVGDFITQGGGSGNGDGWIDDPGPNPGGKSINDTLISQGYLANGSGITDPKCGLGTYSSVCPGYIKANCTVAGSPATFLMARLETVSYPQSAPAVITTCGGNALSWWNTYQFNYLVEVY